MASQSLLSLGFPQPDLAVITLDDPAKKVNILSHHVLEDLEKLLDEIDARGTVEGLVFHSPKQDNFIAGADLTEFVAQIDQPAERVIALSRYGQKLFARLSQGEYVTVAAIQGTCLGGGSELAIWCDRRVMARDEATQFGFPEVKLGLFPGWGGTARTPRVVGLYNAVELVTSGDSISATAAETLGLATVVTPGQELEAAIELIRSERTSQQFQRDRAQWAGTIAISDTELGFLGATASAYIQGKTKGHYPAPLAALEVMLGSAGVDVETACRMESESFVQLFGSPVNRGLLNVFFLQDGNKKQGGPAGASAHPIHSATVVGAGVMGQGIAAANVKRGIPVALGDTSEEAVRRGVQGVIGEVSYNKQTRGPDVTKALEFLPLVNGTLSDEELSQADVVVEAIYENAEAKRSLYSRLETQLAGDAILCSNTSTIPITELAHGLAHPERFCGLHFFNPVRRMPLVEVIRGKQTSDDTIATAVAYAKKLKKSPIVVNDGPGFLVNRALMPYMSEALILLEEGATIKQIDRAALEFGMPMGPIDLYDTVGLDVAEHAGQVMCEAFPKRVVESPILPALVAAGRLGKKTGKGFFDYTTDSKGRKKPQPSPEVEKTIQQHADPKAKPENLTERLILPMLLEATRILEDGIAASAEDIDLALIYGIGFPPFRGGLFFWADQQGAAAIVEKLNQYEQLGARYEPTPLLLKYAKSNKKFY